MIGGESSDSGNSGGKRAMRDRGRDRQVCRLPPRGAIVTALVLALTTALALPARTSGDSPTIPRSSSSRVSLSDPHPGDDLSASPPWNPSPKIDTDGFIDERYRRLPGEWESEADIGGRHGPSSRSYRALSEQRAPPVTVRQVPGDGNCLFHSISAALSFAVNGTHFPMRDGSHLSRLRSSSSDLRRAAVDCLSRNPNRRLFLQGSEHLRARELVEAAAAQYDLTGEQYCEQMRRDSYWGGGPEIVALCNVLRRPIHVYELCSVDPDHAPPLPSSGDDDDDDSLSGRENDHDDNAVVSTTAAPSRARSSVHPQFRLRRMACFGSPRFDRREPLHILSADSRFPDVAPGRHLPTGNHFLALFPVPKRRGGGPKRGGRAGRTRARVRGGGGGGVGVGTRVGKASAAASAAPRRKRGADGGRISGAASGAEGGGWGWFGGRSKGSPEGRREMTKIRPDSDGGGGGGFFGRIGRMFSPCEGDSSRVNDSKDEPGGAVLGFIPSIVDNWLGMLFDFLGIRSLV